MDPQAGAPSLAADSIEFAYRRHTVVLRDIRLAIRRGEVVGILGPNGSGKSTLLRLLSGWLRPQRGTVTLWGRNLASYSAKEIARHIAVVPQETHVDFPFTVMELVLMGRAAHLRGYGFESPADIALARAAMDRVEVAHLASRMVQELSGGERQRVVLARALAQDTPILLLDEPGAFLDLHHVVAIYDLLRDLAAEGRAVVTVLHDLNLAALYCDRVFLLHRGTVFCAGTPAEVITYKNVAEVYETEVYVDVNDLTGAVNVLPLSRPYREQLRKQFGRRADC
ncbi:MAG: heme ABC transporter ATP-binding protein [Candidatus Binatia bacterium]|nr:heme ABC transporter ATP-binding protein [Candidatus Binatia bacterium]